MKKQSVKKNTSQKKMFSQPKDYGMLVLGIISILYLLNFTFGLVEILPDTLPILGNLDEAFMTALLVSVLQYFDIDPTKWFKRS